MMTCFHENKVIFANIKHIVELPRLNYPLVNFIERTIFYQEIPQNFIFNLKKVYQLANLFCIFNYSLPLAFFWDNNPANDVEKKTCSE